jgi:hypothetical protein
MNFQSEGELNISASTDQQVWTTIKNKSIVRADVPSFLVPATMSGTSTNL